MRLEDGMSERSAQIALMVLRRSPGEDFLGEGFYVGAFEGRRLERRKRDPRQSGRMI
jgi:hypothetical protein